MGKRPARRARSQRTRAVLRRCQTDFVALTVGHWEFSELVNRRDVLEKMAELAGEQPESGPG